MSIEHPAGLIAVIAGILAFHGSIYALVSLNVGWRFGYWLTSATMGGLMLFITVFWYITALGPRGEEPRWILLSAGADEVAQASFEDTTFTSPSQYPSAPWLPAGPKDKLFPENDAMKSSVSSCLSSKPGAAEEEPAAEADAGTLAAAEACRQALALAPPEDSLPKVGEDATPVAVSYELQSIRFTEEAGTLLSQATVSPVTKDPRVADDPKKGEPVGRPFRVVLLRDPGSIRVPAVAYLVGSIIYFAFHLWGLSRAERRKLSPVAA